MSIVVARIKITGESGALITETIRLMRPSISMWSGSMPVSSTQTSFRRHRWWCPKPYRPRPAGCSTERGRRRLRADGCPWAEGPLPSEVGRSANRRLARSDGGIH